ncbi:MAG: SHOCT domain-containing protein, partial [Phycisphaerae bacterium]
PDPMTEAFSLFQQMSDSGLITDEEYDQLKNRAIAYIHDTADTAGGVPMHVGKSFLHTARRLRKNLRKYRRLHEAGTIDRDEHRKLHNMAIHRFTRNWG